MKWFCGTFADILPVLKDLNLTHNFYVVIFERFSNIFETLYRPHSKNNPYKRSKTIRNSKILDATRERLALLSQRIRRMKSYNP
jgi:hypothetical protein